ncbi:Uma2 family endonuclease [Actinomadura terrae]|uniref:Uma2 family endonuclease n=1 Tax=Actinomadura terrae TaxID=604353 RepID=UPI001FA7FCC6|nr:Uma2 family endonuclease [Actinomadura terrae]
MRRTQGRPSHAVTASLERLISLAAEAGLDFSKVESLGDTVVLLAGRCWEHSANIDLVRKQIPRERRHTVSGVDLRLTSEPTEPVPDLIVVPEPLAPGAKPWAHETELLVEVVSQRNYREDYEGKRRRYAQSGAPQYLLVDPRDGVCVLYTVPLKGEGTYDEIVTTKFGQPVEGVLCMDGGPLDTSEFLRYT